VTLALAWLAEAGASLVAAAGVAGDGLPERLPFPRYMETWHDCCLLAGTAAVTLAGLLFIALALHLDQMVEESHEHLLALSRAMLTSFIVVLTASLVLLEPAFSRRITGVTLAAAGAAGAILTLKLMAGVRHHDEGGFSKRKVARRRLLPMIGYGIIAVSGIGIAFGVQELMNWTVASFAMLLGNGAGTSFELLVHVARFKKQARESRGA
jgi:hypothetical protein